MKYTKHILIKVIKKLNNTTCHHCRTIEKKWKIKTQSPTISITQCIRRARWSEREGEREHGSTLIIEKAEATIAKTADNDVIGRVLDVSTFSWFFFSIFYYFFYLMSTQKATVYVVIVLLNREPY